MSLFKPFRRRPRPVYCGQPEREAIGQRSGVIADQNAARPVLQSADCSGDHQFHARASFRDPPFHAQARSRPVQRDQHFNDQAAPELHILLFAVAHTYQNVGRVRPPPPPRGLSV